MNKHNELNFSTINYELIFFTTSKEPNIRISSQIRRRVNTCNYFLPEYIHLKVYNLILKQAIQLSMFQIKFLCAYSSKLTTICKTCYRMSHHLRFCQYTKKWLGLGVLLIRDTAKNGTSKSTRNLYSC